jgi:hypothetical protein
MLEPDGAFQKEMIAYKCKDRWCRKNRPRRIGLKWAKDGILYQIFLQYHHRAIIIVPLHILLRPIHLIICRKIDHSETSCKDHGMTVGSFIYETLGPTWAQLVPQLDPNLRSWGTSWGTSWSVNRERPRAFLPVRPLHTIKIWDSGSRFALAEGGPRVGASSWGKVGCQVLVLCTIWHPTWFLCPNLCLNLMWSWDSSWA